MLSVDIKKITMVEVVPWERGTFGVAYATSDGQQGADLIGSKVEAEAIVRRVGMNLNTAADELGIMSRGIAAS